MDNDNSSNRGRNLTPASRESDTSKAAMVDGLICGGLTAIPNSALIYYLYRNNASFRKLTNNQSRTALCIMPPLFAFALASELTMNNLKREMAEEVTRVERSCTTATTTNTSNTYKINLDEDTSQQKLQDLYMSSNNNRNNKRVRIVKGDQLSMHHYILNFWQENPFKMLFALGVPTVVYVFQRYQKKDHVPFQLKIMQTRVIGQFSVIAFLLGLMSVKGFMDSRGRYVTEAEAKHSIEYTRQIQAELQAQLARDRENEELAKQFLYQQLQAARERKNKKMLHDDDYDGSENVHVDGTKASKQ